MNQARHVISGGGQVGELIRAKTDWASSSVGAPETWPESLCTVLRLMLGSRYAMWMGWGPDLTFFYNDAYRDQTLGKKHPWALGRPASEVWAEIWDTLSPRIDRVIATGEATWDEGLLLFLERSGFPEETYHTFSYSAAPGDGGEIAGLFCVVIEETERVIGERRLKLLRDLASELAMAKSTADLQGSLERCLVADPREFPFSLTYLFEPDGKSARRVARTVLEDGHPAAPPLLMLDRTDAPWHLQHAAHLAERPRVIELTPALRWPATLWGKAPTHALVVPIAQQGQERPAGAFIAALNPYRPIDEGMKSFAGLVAGQMASAVGNARAFEEEQRRAQALAELDRAKTAFFSNVSHEFRTPLTLMLGPLEDALGSSTKALTGENLETAHRNALRLLKLVNALLDFSRIEAGRVQASYERTDLAALTGELASVFRSAVEKAGLELIVEAEPTELVAYVDRDMWEKIVLNLLSNALKFTFEGAIVVRLRRDGDSAILSVRDTGTGVPAAEIPHLFERFHRVKGARARTQEGSGIGLALVSELVRLHAGRIRVESFESGERRGTMFEVALPLGVSHLPAGRIVSETSARRGLHGAAPYVEEALRWVPQLDPGAATLAEVTHLDVPASERIVLADDNADMRDYLARLLGSRWRVDAVGDGQAALDSIRREPPALVLSDVMMPRLDGFALLHALRADPATRTVPLILLSARAGEEATSEGLAAGANDYLIKPFLARELLARVASQLTIAAVRREAEREREAQRQVITQLFHGAPAGIAMLREPELTIEFANQRMIELWQRSRPSEVLGRPLLEALPELRGQGFDDLLRRVMTTGEPYFGSEVPASFRRDGAQVTRTFNFVYVPMMDASGVVDGVSAFSFDVTQQVEARMRAELGAHVGRAFVTRETLADQLQQCCAALLELGGSSVQIWLYDDAHAWLDLGASAGTPGPAGSSERALLDGTVVGRIARTRAPVLATGGLAELESPHGEWAEKAGLTAFSGYPLITGERLLGVIALYASTPLGGDLLDAVASVADQIALGIDRDASERFRELFIGMLGHDLRNPLNAVLMATHLLMLNASDREKRTLTRIDSSAKRMERMIRQVLDFTRARSGGGIPLVLLPCDLRPILDQVIEELATASPERAIELHVTCDAHGLWDADRMAQVFSNLLGNALTHGARDQPVRADLEREAGRIVFRVKNGGPAIPSELLPRLFDPFRRAHHAKTSATQGLGLGLFISQQIVHAHGGTIAVRSTVAEGTVFTVSLPAQVLGS